jgi:pectate lyase
MRNKLNIVIIFVLTTYLALPSSATESPDSIDPNRYLNAVREFADNVLKYGRDTYGPKHTPLFVDGLIVRDPNNPNYGKDVVFKPVEWIAPNGNRWILSNLASQQNLFRTLDGLTRITGDPKYKQAAMDAIKYAFDNLRSPNGLLYWGGYAAYNAGADRPYKNYHVLKGFYPYYQLMWEVDPQATKQFIEAFWSVHVLDWSNLDINRIGSFNKSMDDPWQHEYKGDPDFYGTGFCPMTTGSDLFYAAAWLTKLSGQKEPLVWGKQLARLFVEARNPKTGISPTFFSWYVKLHPEFAVFPTYYWPALESWPSALGYFMPSPGTLVSPITSDWLCECMLGEMLGSEGHEFTQWANEELMAIGKASYRKKDNVFIPLSDSGVSLEGHIWNEDETIGLKGVMLKPFPLNPSDFWAYVVTYCAAGDKFMWEMARDIAIGNGYGDIGANSTDRPQLTTDVVTSNPHALLGFLELYRKTGNKAFLDASTLIGNNILADRFHKGFFVASNRHVYTKLDALEALVLLHL